MTWPTVPVTTTNLDIGADGPALARTDLLDAVIKENQMMAHVSVFAATVLGDTTATAARATLGAAASAAGTESAANLAGGLAGQIPYQSAVHTTGMLAAGAAGQLMQSNGAAPPSWVNSPGLPAGAVINFAMITAPTGYLKANGAAISRTTYAALFAAIATTFGVGDGSTTFNVPDLRGEFLRGWDDSRGVDAGRAFGSSQADAFKSHSHTINWGVNNAAGSYLSNYVTTDSGPSSTSAVGGTETRPRNIALLACIKY